MPLHLPRRVLLFGAGYSAGFIRAALEAQGVEVISTRRCPGDSATRLFNPDNGQVDARLPGDFTTVDALIGSIPPGDEGDPAAVWLARHAPPMPALRWLGYLSSTAVYASGRVDETTPVAPQDEAGRRRVLAETQWQAVAAAHGAALARFRLPAIYGPGRNAITQLRAGTARLIEAPGVRFNRVHVEDIAACVRAALAHAEGDAVWLPCDDLPAAPAEVLRYAAALTGLPLPPAQTLDDPALPPALRRFYRQGEKHIDNRRTRQTLGWQPRFPSYREGLQAVLARAP